MTASSTRRYRLLRFLGRTVTRVAAALTLGNLPPFVSTSAIVTDGDSLLVVIDPIHQEPILPGGHLRWSEKPEHAVIREVHEETGIVIEPGPLVAVLSGDEWAGERGVVRIIYTGRVTGGSLVSSGEGEATWIPLAGASSRMERDGKILERWRERVL